MAADKISIQAIYNTVLNICNDKMVLPSSNSSILEGVFSNILYVEAIYGAFSTLKYMLVGKQHIVGGHDPPIFASVVLCNFLLCCIDSSSLEPIKRSFKSLYGSRKKEKTCERFLN